MAMESLRALRKRHLLLFFAMCLLSMHSFREERCGQPKTCLHPSVFRARRREIEAVNVYSLFTFSLPSRLLLLTPCLFISRPPTIVHPPHFPSQRTSKACWQIDIYDRVQELPHSIEPVAPVV